MKKFTTRIIADVTEKMIACKRVIIYILIFLDTFLVENRIKEYGTNRDSINRKSKYTKIIYMGIKTAII